MRKVELCDIDRLPEGTSRGFSVQGGEGPVDLFLVRDFDGIHAYLNSCPHTGGPLDWVPDQFLNLDGDFIQCATHAALFRIDSGECVSGPCAGQSLAALPVEVCGGKVFVALK